MVPAHLPPGQAVGFSFLHVFLFITLLGMRCGDELSEALLVVNG